MQIKYFLAFLLLFPWICHAQSVTGPQHSGPPLNVNDGSTSCYPYSIAVSSGTLACSNGIATVTTGGGSGGSSQWITTNVGIGTYDRVGIGTITPNASLIVASGNVGIGSLSPGNRVDVQGDLRLSYPGSGSSTGSIWINKFSNTSQPQIYIYAADAALSAPKITLEVASPSTGTPTISAIGGNLGLSAGSSTNAITLSTNAGEVARATSGGNLGIGSTAPGFKLDVNGGIRSVTGNVAIGTANANNVLEVAGGNSNFNSNLLMSSSSAIYYLNNLALVSGYLRIFTQGTATSTVQLGSVSGAGDHFVQGAKNLYLIGGGDQASAGTENIYFGTNQLFRGIVDNNGNWGIGGATSGNTPLAPINKLEVAGGIAIGAGYTGAFTAPSNGMIVQGNIGIGTTIPQSGLVVMNGNVGIGTWKPSGVLQINRNANPFIVDANSNLGIGTTASQTALSVMSGNVGIGTWAPTQTLQVNGGLSTYGNSGNVTLVVGGGNVGINTVTPGVLLDVFGGTMRVSALASDSGATDSTVCARTTDGLFFKGSGTLGICLGTSTKEAKTNIIPIPAGLGDLMKLKPILFNYKPGWGYSSDKPYYGFLAEDVEKILPILVGHDENGNVRSADYVGLIPVLVKSIQEMQKEINQLKYQIKGE